jgi:hypothetical protein
MKKPQRRPAAGAISTSNGTTSTTSTYRHIGICAPCASVLATGLTLEVGR